VHHPGTKPNPFLENALKEETGAIERHMAGAVAAVAEGAPSSTLRTALHGAGLLVEAKAKELAPVKTGTLRRSIHTTLR